MKRSILLFLPVAGFWLACPGSETPGVELEARCLTLAAQPAPAVRIGQAGSSPFSTLEPGDVLTMDYGPQGGQHVYVALELRFDGEQDWLLEASLAEAGQRVGGASQLVEPCPTGGVLLDGVRLFVDEDRRMDGVEVEVSLTPLQGPPPRAVATARGVVLLPGG